MCPAHIAFCTPKKSRFTWTETYKDISDAELEHLAIECRSAYESLEAEIAVRQARVDIKLKDCYETLQKKARTIKDMGALTEQDKVNLIEAGTFLEALRSDRIDFCRTRENHKDGPDASLPLERASRKRKRSQGHSIVWTEPASSHSNQSRPSNICDSSQPVKQKINAGVNLRCSSYPSEVNGLTPPESDLNSGILATHSNSSNDGHKNANSTVPGNEIDCDVVVEPENQIATVNQPWPKSDDRLQEGNWSPAREAIVKDVGSRPSICEDEAHTSQHTNLITISTIDRVVSSSQPRDLPQIETLPILREHSISDVAPACGVAKDSSHPNEPGNNSQHPKTLVNNPRSYNAVLLNQRQAQPVSYPVAAPNLANSRRKENSMEGNSYSAMMMCNATHSIPQPALILAQDGLIKIRSSSGDLRTLCERYVHSICPGRTALKDNAYGLVHLPCLPTPQSRQDRVAGEEHAADGHSPARDTGSSSFQSDSFASTPSTTKIQLTSNRINYEVVEQPVANAQNPNRSYNIQPGTNQSEQRMSSRSRVMHSPSPPQVLLVAEELYHNIKVYFGVSCKHMIFDDHGTLLNPDGAELHNDLCNEFDSYCFTATMFKGRKLHVGFGHALSKASALVEQILRAEHPRTLACFLEVFIHLIQTGLHDVASILRDFIKKMSEKVIRGGRPWGQICRLLGELDSESLDQAMAQIWKCTTDTFESKLGASSRLAVSVRLDYIKRVYGFKDHLKEERLLRELLAQFNGIQIVPTPRVMLNLAHNLNRQGHHVEAEKMALEVFSLLQQNDIYAERFAERIECMKIVSHSQFNQVKTLEAERTIREAIRMIVGRWGIQHSWVLEFMNVLQGWLRDWGRDDDANTLWEEIEGLMRKDEIYEQLDGMQGLLCQGNIEEA